MADDTSTATIVATVDGSSDYTAGPVRFDDVDSDVIDLLGDGGILKKVIKPPATSAKGPPAAGAQVSAHYTGTLVATGAQFDSSHDRGRPHTFQVGLGQVIKGWDVAVSSMKVGERAVVRIRADYAYGSGGFVFVFFFFLYT